MADSNKGWKVCFKIMVSWLKHFNWFAQGNKMIVSAWMEFFYQPNKTVASQHNERYGHIQLHCHQDNPVDIHVLYNRIQGIPIFFHYSVIGEWVV